MKSFIFIIFFFTSTLFSQDVLLKKLDDIEKKMDTMHSKLHAVHEKVHLPQPGIKPTKEPASSPTDPHHEHGYLWDRLFNPAISKPKQPEETSQQITSPQNQTNNQKSDKSPLSARKDPEFLWNHLFDPKVDPSKHLILPTSVVVSVTHPGDYPELARQYLYSGEFMLPLDKQLKDAILDVFAIRKGEILNRHLSQEDIQNVHLEPIQFNYSHSTLTHWSTLERPDLWRKTVRELNLKDARNAKDVEVEVSIIKKVSSKTTP